MNISGGFCAIPRIGVAIVDVNHVGRKILFRSIWLVLASSPNVDSSLEKERGELIANRPSCRGLPLLLQNGRKRQKLTSRDVACKRGVVVVMNTSMVVVVE